MPDILSNLEISLPLNGDAADISGNGHNGTLAGGMGFGSTGRISGAAATFDGVDDHIVIPHVAALSPNAISVGAWVYPTTWGSGLITIASKVSSGSPFPSWDVRLNGILQAEIIVSGTSYIANSPYNLIAGLWQHIGFTYDLETLIFFYMGLAGTSNTSPSGNLTGVTTDLWLGSNPSFPSGRYFNGLMNDFRLYTRGLATADMAALAAIRPAIGGVVNSGLIG